MATRIAVAGATGRLGHHVVDVLTERSHDVVPISRATDVDLLTGAGLVEALTGVDHVIDAATGPSPDLHEATDFFTTAARNLHGAAHSAGVGQIVVVSIIGIDQFTAGYNAAKIAHEKAHLAGLVPVRILRAAQFHEFVGQLVDWGRQGDMAYVPNWATQLVSARTVAEALVDLVEDAADTEPPREAEPWSPVPEIAGPREENLAEAARLLAARRGEALTIVPVLDESDPDHHVYASKGLLPNSHAMLAGPTFEEWLDTNS